MELTLSFFLPFLWIYYLHRKDKHPEPITWLIFAFLLGILAAYLSFKVEETLIFLGLNNTSFNYFFLASFIEEFFKFLVILVFIFPRKVFDEPIDAMIYMMFSAFGFAFVENFLYLLGFRELRLAGEIGVSEEIGMTTGLFIIAFLRFLGPNLIHILSSSLIGFGYSLKVATRHYLPLVISFISAGILHFLFNWIIIKSSVEINNFFFLSFLIPIIWSAFWVVIIELDYLSINGRKQKSK